MGDMQGLQLIRDITKDSKKILRIVYE